MALNDDDVVLADAATRSMISTNVNLCRVMEHGFVRLEPGVAAVVSGGQIPSMNAVLVSEPTAEIDTAARLIDDLVATGLPNVVVVRPAALPKIQSVLTDRGRSRVDELPFMVRTESQPPPVTNDSLRLVELRPGQIAQHATLLAAGFEIPVELLDDIVVDQAFAAPGFRCYVGEVAGEPVTTGVGMLTDGWLGLFNIATAPAHTRRGYGGAVTARIVADGLAAGAQAAYLQSTSVGYGVYQQLGFRTVEEWSIWA
jgi:hypothetical protein